MPALPTKLPLGLAGLKVLGKLLARVFNVLPYGEYVVNAFTLDDGDRCLMQLDEFGNIKVVDAGGGVPTVDRTAHGDILLFDDEVDINTQGCAICDVVLSGAWTGQAQFEGMTADGVWTDIVAIPMMPFTGNDGEPPTVFYSNANGRYRVRCADLLQVRVRQASISPTGTLHADMLATAADIDEMSEGFRNRINVIEVDDAHSPMFVEVCTEGCATCSLHVTAVLGSVFAVAWYGMSADGTTWSSIPFRKQLGTGPEALSTAAVGDWFVACGPYKKIGANVVVTSGLVDVYLSATVAATPDPALSGARGAADEGRVTSTMVDADHRAWDVVQYAHGDNTATGTIPHAPGTGNVAINTQGCAICLFTVSGTYSGDLVFEGQQPDLTWAPCIATPVVVEAPRGVPNAVNDALPPSVTGYNQAVSHAVNLSWRARVAGLLQVRVRGASVTAGTATVSMVATSADIAEPAEGFRDRKASGTFSGVVVHLEVSTEGCATCTINIDRDGDPTHPIQFLGRKPGGGLEPIYCAPFLNGRLSGAAAEDDAGIGGFFAFACAGYEAVRLDSGAISDDALVDVEATVAARADLANADNKVVGAIATTQSIEINTQGKSICVFTINGTPFTGTLEFEGQKPDLTWAPCIATPVIVEDPFGPPNAVNDAIPPAVISYNTGFGPPSNHDLAWRARCAGLLQVRVRGASVTAGTCTVSMVATSANIDEPGEGCKDRKAYGLFGPGEIAAVIIQVDVEGCATCAFTIDRDGDPTHPVSFTGVSAGNIAQPIYCDPLDGFGRPSGPQVTSDVGEGGRFVVACAGYERIRLTSGVLIDAAEINMTASVAARPDYHVWNDAPQPTYNYSTAIGDAPSPVRASNTTLTWAGPALTSGQLKQVRIITTATDRPLMWEQRRNAVLTIAGAVITVNALDGTTITVPASATQIDLTWAAQDKAIAPATNSIQNSPMYSDRSARVTTPSDVIVAAQTLTTSWLDLGPEFNVDGFKFIALRVQLTKQQADQFRFRCLRKDLSGGLIECWPVIAIPIVVGTPAYYDCRPEYMQFTASELAAQDAFELQFKLNANTPYVQFQAMVGSDPGTHATVDSAKITYAY